MNGSEQIIGRYALHAEIASGGMATVHIGRLLGPVGFSRTVAIKRLHPQFAKDPEFVSMFLDEARLAARIRHRNVVSVLDVVALSGELFLVMDYVEGEPLSRLLKNMREQQELVDLDIAVSILNESLLGLHAAHEALSAQGQRLNLVHRDVSPQNLLVGIDGTCRVVDFGVAKAANRLQTTRDGQLKGKIAYMSPEQIQSKRVDRRTDVFAAGVVAWELLTGRRLRRGEEPAAMMAQIITKDAPRPSLHRGDISPQLDDVILKALNRDVTRRFETAKEMALALEEAIRPATSRRVADWVELLAGDSLQRRAETVAHIERRSEDGIALGEGRPSFGPAAPDSVAEPPSADDSGIHVSHQLERLAAKPHQKWLIAATVGCLLILILVMLAGGDDPVAGNDEGSSRSGADTTTNKAAPPASDDESVSITTTATARDSAEPRSAAPSPASTQGTTPTPRPSVGPRWPPATRAAPPRPPNRSNKWDQL